MIVDEIAQYMHDQGIGVYSDDVEVTYDGEYIIYIDWLPDTADKAIALMSMGGQAPDVAVNLGRPSVQIIVRGGTTTNEAATKAAAIHSAFHGLHDTEFVSGGTRVMLCSCRQSEPIRLGPDENGRQEYSINLMLITGGN